MLQKSSIQKTLEVFFSNPNKKFSLKEISQISKLAHTSVKRNIKYLIKEGLVQKFIEIKGKRKFPLYSALNNDDFKKQKIINNLKIIFESGLIDFLEEKFFPKSIVLFGSFRWGEDTSESDIDIFLECKEEKVKLKNFEKKLNRKIQLHFKENFSSYPKELKNNIINGILLKGFLEVYK